MENLAHERELLLQLSEGNQDSFAKLLNHYRDHVFSHALTYVKSFETAEEIVQDIFLKVWNNRRDINKVENFKAYLFILSKNHLISAIRKKVKSISSEACLSQTSSLPDPGQQLEAKETLHLILRGVEQLSSQQKAVFTMSRFDNMCYDQISDRLHISKGTVKFHMVIALNYLRKYMRFDAIHPGILLAICTGIILY